MPPGTSSTTTPLLFLLSLLPLSLSTPLTLPLNTTRSPTLQCIDSPSWTTPNFLAGDCYTAIDKLHNRRVEQYGGALLEFFAADIKPPYPSRFAQPTPQRYRYKSCTLAVVMVRDLPPGVEGPGVGQRGSSDLCSYATLIGTARGVLRGCGSVVLPWVGGGRLGFVNPVGWDVAGNRKSIGVFLWDTASVINGQIPVAGNGGGGVEGLVRRDWGVDVDLEGLEE